MSMVDRPAALFAGVEPLEVFVELLAEIDTETSSTEFYDRICEAICRLTTMRRAAIFMADAARRRVRAVGSHGTPPEQLVELRPTLVNTPIAQQALRDDEVVVVSERIEEWVPPDYAKVLGITTLVCTPMSAAGRDYGVICADRGGGRFELTDGERHLLWTLGKTAALVTTARTTTRQQERNRHLAERLGLAREIHERVLQRLFGVSLALSAEAPLSADERERCRMEMQQALRSAPGFRAPARTGCARDRADARRGARAARRRARAAGARRMARRRRRAGRARAARAVGAHRGDAQRRQARRPDVRRRGRGR